MTRPHPHSDAHSDTRPVPVRRGRSKTRTITFNLEDTGVAVWCAPAILGFWPHNSAVFLVCRSGRMECAIRLDLDAPVAEACERVAHARDQFPGAGVLLLGYGPRDTVMARLREFQLQCDPATIIDVIATDQREWWTLHGTSGSVPGEMPSAFLPGASRGAQLLPDRTAAAQSIAGPSAEQLTLLAGLTTGELTWFAEREPVERQLAMRELLDQASLDGVDTLTTRELLRLAVLTLDPPARDIALLAVRRSSAAEAVRLWQAVIGVSCEDIAAGPLCLAGHSGWLTGDGALLTMCLERCATIDTTYPLFGLLSQVHWTALSPEKWEQALMMAGERAAMPRRPA